MRSRRALAAASAAAALLAAAIQAQCRPLYAARTGKSCASCHVNPAGGWMRSPTGFAYALNGHTTTPAEEPEQTIDPKVSDGIRLGGDLRTMYIQDVDNPASKRSTFFLMSAILFTSLDLNNRVTLYYSNDQGRSFETYGLLRVLPLNGAVKVGRFRPAYGMNEEDHTTFTQDSLGFGNFSEDTGIEVTMDARRAYLSAGIVNGIPGGTLDTNPQKGAYGRLWSYNDRVGLGVTGYVNMPAQRTRLYRFGALGQLHYGPVVLLGEIDRGGTKELGPGGRDRRLGAGFAEVAVQLHEKATAKLKYDRFDRDLTFRNTARDRLGIWLESDIAPFVRLIGTFRGTKTYADDRTVYDLLGQLFLFF